MKKYGIIYADPPWAYRNKHCEGNALAHYNTMRLEDICNLPVREIAAQDCVLFLWATYPMLPEALRVIEAWGFKYKTIGFAWIKQNRKADSLYMGTGYWTRANSEVCLLAIKGKPKRISASVHSVIVSHIREHSAQKKTCLWLKGLPKLEPTNIVDRGEMMGNYSIGAHADGRDDNGKWLRWGPELAKLRSRTFPGIAKVLKECLENLASGKSQIRGESVIKLRMTPEKVMQVFRICPACGNPYAGNRYCDRCGQRLEW